MATSYKTRIHTVAGLALAILLTVLTLHQGWGNGCFDAVSPSRDQLQKAMDAIEKARLLGQGPFARHPHLSVKSVVVPGLRMQIFGKTIDIPEQRYHVLSALDPKSTTQFAEIVLSAALNTPIRLNRPLSRGGARDVYFNPIDPDQVIKVFHYDELAGIRIRVDTFERIARNYAVMTQREFAIGEILLDNRFRVAALDRRYPILQEFGIVLQKRVAHPRSIRTLLPGFGWYPGSPRWRNFNTRVLRLEEELRRNQPDPNNLTHPFRHLQTLSAFEGPTQVPGMRLLDFSPRNLVLDDPEQDPIFFDY